MAAFLSPLFFMPDGIGRNAKKRLPALSTKRAGAASLAMSEYNSDAIDKVTDARAKKSFEHSEIRIVRTQRADARRDKLSPPMRRAIKAELTLLVRDVIQDYSCWRIWAMTKLRRVL